MVKIMFAKDILNNQERQQFTIKGWNLDSTESMTNLKQRYLSNTVYWKTTVPKFSKLVQRLIDANAI